MVYDKVSSSNQNQNDMCYNESGLYAQNIDINLGLIITTLGRAYVINLISLVSLLLMVVSQLQSKNLESRSL